MLDLILFGTSYIYINVVLFSTNLTKLQLVITGNWISLISSPLGIIFKVLSTISLRLKECLTVVQNESGTISKTILGRIFVDLPKSTIPCRSWNAPGLAGRSSYIFFVQSVPYHIGFSPSFINQNTHIIFVKTKTQYFLHANFYTQPYYRFLK